jgi:HD superfamily phosphohydrolase
MKNIIDTVWGKIQLCELATQVEQSFEFQRLKFIAQLGANHMTNTTSMHNRYQHSIGTSYLAKLVCTNLKVDERNSDLIQVAAMCHDIGHGPLSHMFDKLCDKYTCQYNRHENRSCIIIKHIIKKYDIDVTIEEIQFICDIIDPPIDKKNNWKYQIVSGNIDVDRIDYLIRDQYNTGITTTFNKIMAMNIINSVSINNNESLEFINAESDIIEMLNSRDYMYSKVYKTNHTVDIENDIIKVLTNCIKCKDILDDIFLYEFNIEKFIELTDVDLLKIYYKNK